MTATALVTGVNGFVAPHVVRHLKSVGVRVVGTAKDPSPRAGMALDEYVPADLVAGMPALPSYDHVIHLAGLSAVGPSFDEPHRYLESNGAMTLNVLRAHQETQAKGRVVVVSTGAVYDGRTGKTLDEDSPIACTSPYVVSKLLTENIAAYYTNRGVDAVVVRPFNHIGPGQTAGFLVPDLYDSLIKMPTSGALPVGDLSTSRDYTDVRDVAKAYISVLLAEHLRHRLYNVCSGVSISGEEMLGYLCRATGRPVPKTAVNTARLRPSEQRAVQGSAQRLRSDTGWEPKIPLDKTIHDYVDQHKKDIA